jgi:hypothetical protein
MDQRLWSIPGRLWFSKSFELFQKYLFKSSQDLFNRTFNEALKTPAYIRYCISAVSICSHFSSCRHELCPEDRVFTFLIGKIVQITKLKIFKKLKILNKKFIHFIILCITTRIFCKFLTNHRSKFQLLKIIIRKIV